MSELLHMTVDKGLREHAPMLKMIHQGIIEQGNAYKCP